MSELLGVLSAAIGLDLTELEVKAKEAKLQFAELDAEAETRSAKISGSMKVAGAAMAGVALVVGVESVKAAEADEGAQARLETALKNTGHSFDEYKVKIEEQSKAFANLGISNAQYEDALSKMEAFTKDPIKAMDDMRIASDVAAATHKDLASATQIVGLAADGNVLKLKQLGINLDLTAGNAKAVAKAQAGLKDAQEALTAAVAKAGPAAAASVTKEKLAQDALAKVQSEVNSGKLKGKDASDALARAQLALTTAHANLSKSSDTVAKAQDKVKEAQDKMAKSTDSSEVALAALSDLYGGQASAQAETFQGKTDAVKAKTENLSAALGEKLIPMILKGIDKFNQWTDDFERGWHIFELGSVALVRHGEEVWGNFQRGIQTIRDAWNAFTGDFKAGQKEISDDWDAFWATFERGADRIGHVFSSAWGTVKSSFADAINFLVRGWNTFADSFGSVHVPGTDTTFSVPHMQPVKFHQGGTVPGSPGTEVLAVLQAGERVTPVSMTGDGAQVHTEITINGNVGNDQLTQLKQLLAKRDAQLIAALRTNSGSRRGR